MSWVTGGYPFTGIRLTLPSKFLWPGLARMLGRMAAELNDNALMLRYRDGDMAAFETLYSRHKGPLFRFLLRQISNQQFAEDVFQEVWGKIIRSRKNYRPSAKFSTYLYRIARNCSVDHYRRSSKQPALLPEQGAVATEPVATSGNPEAEAENREARHLLIAALDGLPEDQREVFLLHEESGFTLEEISEITAAGRETVKSRLRYALKKLRSCVAEPAMTGVNHD